MILFSYFILFIYVSILIKLMKLLLLFNLAILQNSISIKYINYIIKKIIYHIFSILILNMDFFNNIFYIFYQYLFYYFYKCSNFKFIIKQIITFSVIVLLK